MVKLSRALSYFSVCLVSVYCLYTFTKLAIGFIDASLIILALYGMLGFLTQVADSGCVDVGIHLHYYTSFLLLSVVLPCLLTEIWLKDNISPIEAAYGFSLAGATLALAFTFMCLKSALMDIFVLVNGGLLGAIGFQDMDVFVILASALFLGAHFLVARQERDIVHMSPSDVYNYFMAGFSYCATMSVVN